VTQGQRAIIAAELNLAKLANWGEVTAEDFSPMTELFSAQNRAPAVCSMISGWTVSASERAAPASMATAADSGVVLCVAGGIVRIAAGIIRAAVRLSGGIDRLIGVAAGESERRDHEDDAESVSGDADHARCCLAWPGDGGRPRRIMRSPMRSSARASVSSVMLGKSSSGFIAEGLGEAILTAIAVPPTMIERQIFLGVRPWPGNPAAIESRFPQETSSRH
jgi:hypothetical protein